VSWKYITQITQVPDISNTYRESLWRKERFRGTS